MLNKEAMGLTIIIIIVSFGMNFHVERHVVTCQMQNYNVKQKLIKYYNNYVLTSTVLAILH